ncbi:MAG: hypothetical protein AB1782_02785, partial [Cyanobacteriota bacterium]
TLIADNVGGPINQLDTSLTGAFSATLTGSLYLNEINNDLNIGLIDALTGNVTIDTSGRALIDVNNDGASNIIAQSFIFNGGDIGSALNPFEIDLTNDFSGTSTGNVYLTETSVDFQINLLTALGDVILNCPGDFIDSAFDNNANVDAVNIVLNSISIGDATNYFDILATGSINATATNDIFLAESNGNMEIDLITSTAGTVNLRTVAGDILDFNFDGNPNIVASDILFETGSIGTSVNHFDIDSTGGLVSLIVTGDSYLNETNGSLNVLASSVLSIFLEFTSQTSDISVDSISTMGNVTLNAPNGGIIDFNNNFLPEIIATDLQINSDFIGSFINEFDINITGNLITTTNMDQYIFSTDGNLNIQSVQSTAGDVTLNVAAGMGGVLDANNDPAADIVANNLYINADYAGTLANPLDVFLGSFFNAQVAGDLYITEPIGNLDAGLVQSPAGDINLTSVAGNLNVDFISTTGITTLNALSGSINDINDDANTNVASDTLIINCQSIGTALNYFDIDLTNILDVLATNDIFISENNGNMDVQSVVSSLGNIYLNSVIGNINVNIIDSNLDTYLTATNGVIIDANNDINPNVLAQDLSITSQAIGSNLNNFDFDLTGDFSAQVDNDLFVTETNGNFIINTVQSASGNAYLTSNNGNIGIINIVNAPLDVILNALNGMIIDSANTAAPNIFADNLTINAMSVGNNLNYFDIDLISDLFVNANGDIYIIETTGPMTPRNVQSATANIYLTSLNDNINVGLIQTPLNVFLNASGDVTDINNDALPNIFSNNLTINSNSIGNLLDPLEVDLNGLLDIQTTNQIVLDETNGPINTGNITSVVGFIRLRSLNGGINLGRISTTNDIELLSSLGPIIDANNDNLVDISASNAILTAQAIGDPLNHVEINIPGLLNTNTTLDINLTQVNNDLNINNAISTAGGISFITNNGNIIIRSIDASGDVSVVSQTGYIIDSDDTDDSLTNIIADGNLYLESNNGSDFLGIGSDNGINSMGDLDIDLIGNLTAIARNGSIFIHQVNGDLIIDNTTTDAIPGCNTYIQSNGGIYNTANTITTYNLDLISNGNIGELTNPLIVQINNNVTLSLDINSNSNNVYINQGTGDVYYTSQNSGTIVINNSNGSVFDLSGTFIINTNTTTTTTTTNITTYTPVTTSTISTTYDGDEFLLNQDSGNIYIYDKSTGKISIISNYESDNVIQNDVTNSIITYLLDDGESIDNSEFNSNQANTHGSDFGLGSAFFDSISSDNPIDTASASVMTTLFSICKGIGTCSDIDTSENIDLAFQSFTLSNDNEFEADKYGTQFAVNCGYHPAGLEGFLITLEKIEQSVNNISSNIDRQYTPVFSYRHPKTTARIDIIKDIIDDKNLLKVKSKKINKKFYKSIIANIK